MPRTRKRIGLHALPLTGLVLAAVACRTEENPGPPKPDAPATVNHPVNEANLATITLSEKAEARLGIKIATVQSRRIQRTRTVGGEIMVPPGRRIAVHAPLSGTLFPLDGRAPLAPGERLTDGQVILRLSPVFLADKEVLAPSDRINLARARADLAAAGAQAEGDVSAALVEVEAATIKLKRAEQLVKGEAGSVRAYQEAGAEARLAQSRVKAAQRRLRILRDTNLEAESGTVASLPIESPHDGVLQALYALPGEAVAAGTALFIVAALDPVWVRVPVYAGDLDAIDKGATAGVTDVSFRPDAPDRPARPVASPPAADATAATVDLVYELTNPDAQLLPGMRVGVRLSLEAAEESLVVPWSAVVYDFNGGSWVYEKTDAHTFVRRRVALKHVAEGMAVLARGPTAGTQVVTVGAAELFGTEFGSGK